MLYIYDMEEKYYSISEFSKIVGYTPRTLRSWDSNGKLHPNHRSIGNHRYYSQTQADQLLGKKPSNLVNKNIGYVRVSSQGQKDDLQRQSKAMEIYLIAQGAPFEIIEDIGSGLNYKKKGLNQLIDLIESNTVSKIFVMYQDRLIRFGFELIQKIASLHNVEIVVINQSDSLSDSEEMANDIMQIITVFSARMYGKRSHKNKRLINDVKKDLDL